MSKAKSVYICSECGYESSGYLGKCPNCNNWGTIKESLIQNIDKRSSLKIKVNFKKASQLSQVKTSSEDRVNTGIKEFDRVMGGGIVKDSVTILSAVPGAGKSTLLLQVANKLGLLGHKVLYASGEESENQIKNRANRIIDDLTDNLWVISDNSMDSVVNLVEEVEPKIIIVDSIQTFTLSEYSTSRAGSPTQTMECANTLVNIAKNSEDPKIVIMVGQMTKENEIAGVRALEHLVDTVLLIDGESSEELRSLIARKNRYGSTGEMGFFKMTEKGMESIDNPSEYFMTERKKDELVSGSALSTVKEGTRSIVLEIESLVSQSFTPYPARISECLSREQLNTLVSILEQRAGYRLYDKNIVVKTTGGIKLNEQASNLTVLMSIVSSIEDKGINNDTAFIADVGLTGELKPIPSLEQRLRELDRMGFKRAYISPNNARNIKLDNLEIIENRTLRDVIKDVFK